jgi:acetate kinase
MCILVVNSGSSSVKFSMFETNSAGSRPEPNSLYEGELSNIGEADAGLTLQKAGSAKDSKPSRVSAPTTVDAIRLVFDTVCGPEMPTVGAVGYRVVHPGSRLRGHQKITTQVLRDLEAAVAFAPLHEPTAISAIREGMQRFPNVEHFACFDTVFHETMPEQATTYPIPEKYRQLGARRYGFHGLSCESVVMQMRLGGGRLAKRIVIAHLGSGCSVTAVIDGCSVDTTMGLTPTGGVVMGARPGDFDPGLLIYMLRQEKSEGEKVIAEIEKVLDGQAGMAAISGLPNDMKATRMAAGQGDANALLALQIFTRSITKAIGGFCWLMGGLDSIVFTGGIGEHDPFTRDEVLENLQGLGISLDAASNDAKESGVRRISAPESRVAVYVIPAEEDLMIARHVNQLSLVKH